MSKDLLIVGRGFATQDIALKTGQQVRDALTQAFATLRVAADFIGFGEKGAPPTPLKLDPKIGPNFLDRAYGLVAFESGSPPLFPTNAYTTMTIVASKERFFSVFSKAINASSHLTDRQRLAYELFSASLFERTEEARFLFLAMAVEVPF